MTTCQQISSSRGELFRDVTNHVHAILGVLLKLVLLVTIQAFLPLQALPIFLRALTIPVHRDTIHSGVRQYLHRMIVCLGDSLLPFIPVAVSHLLVEDCTVSVKIPSIIHVHLIQCQDTFYHTCTPYFNLVTVLTFSCWSSN